MALCLETHPSMPFCEPLDFILKKICLDLFHIFNFLDLSGHENGVIQLWQFEQSLPLLSFTTGNKFSIHHVHFDRSGSRFLALDVSGYLSIWKFDTVTQRLPPFVVSPFS